MKCILTNTCNKHPKMCCHFCNDKNCYVRCNDDHKHCQWFEDVPLEELDEQGKLFKYVSDGKGGFKRYYFTEDELQQKLYQQKVTRFRRSKG